MSMSPSFLLLTARDFPLSTAHNSTLEKVSQTANTRHKLVNLHCTAMTGKWSLWSVFNNRPACALFRLRNRRVYDDIYIHPHSGGLVSSGPTLYSTSSLGQHQYNPAALDSAAALGQTLHSSSALGQPRYNTSALGHPLYSMSALGQSFYSTPAPGELLNSALITEQPQYASGQFQYSTADMGQPLAGTTLISQGQPAFHALGLGIPQQQGLGLRQTHSSTSLNQNQYPSSVFGQFQSVPPAAQGLHNSSIILPNGSLPTVPGPRATFLSGGLNLLQAPATSNYPTIDELYSSLNQLPPMRSSISLQNLHQGTFW
jgi:hypothetical protein